MEKALVLGAEGLLGSRLCRNLLSAGFDVIGTSRNIESTDKSEVRMKVFRIGDNLEELLSTTNPRFIYNCTVAKSNTAGTNLWGSLYVNSFFPRLLLDATRKRDIRLFSFSTDAVFAGRKESSDETRRRLPTSVYGITKMLGEVSCESSLILRFSMVAALEDITHSKNNFTSKIVNLPLGSEIYACTKPRWNGVTVGALAKLITKLSTLEHQPNGIRHFYTSTTISKYELVKLLAKLHNREDLVVIPTKSDTQNAVLTTRYREDLDVFWRLIGFTSIPDIENLILSS